VGVDECHPISRPFMMPPIMFGCTIFSIATTSFISG
jgi:hypothetical protein